MSSEESVMSSPGTMLSSDGKSAGFSQPQTEKPFHYTYLKEFRVDQCPLFLQHKCTAHRPFTCFNWHFMNQRRRRPKKKRDGTFNYSPDVYCSQYDETTGICPSGDDCPYLHRVAGDVERRYHLRYYKTATCVHETDARGYCVKNGPHCAFAHGPHDLRQPVYDVRELQGTDKEEIDVLQIAGVDSRAAIEDARWQDTNFVLSNYKTEPCKKPPRLCRQGYACPHFHNSRDRRRSPRKYRYRSTPCPHVKHGDEWGEPSNCDHCDNCPYCHTRTEQQFHPEIYKSTKCNDMQQTGYCPRGPFCAFAHVDQESGLFKEAPNGEQMQYHAMPPSPMGPGDVFSSMIPQPMSKPSRSLSTSSAGSGASYGSDPSFGMYPKAPGSERSERSCSKEEEQQAFIRKQILAIESDPNLDESEKARRKQSLISARGSVSSSGSTPHTPSSVSAMAAPFYPAADTVESVVESALDELNLEDFDVSELEKELNSTSPVSASFGDGSLCPLSISPMMSAPVSIPGSVAASSNQSYTPQSPTSPLGQFGSSYNSSPLAGPSQKGSNPYRASPLIRSGIHGAVLDPLTAQMQSPNQLGSPLTSPLGNISDLQRMNEELMNARSKLASWEESWTQAKQACDAWKKEAEASAERAKQAEQGKEEAIVKREEAESQVTSLKQEVEGLKADAHLHTITKISELKSLPVSKLRSLQKQLTMDLEKLTQVMSRKEVLLCKLCQEQHRCVVFMPCSHCCLCLSCANNLSECPQCHARVVQRTTIMDIEL